MTLLAMYYSEHSGKPESLENISVYLDKLYKLQVLMTKVNIRTAMSCALYFIE